MHPADIFLFLVLLCLCLFVTFLTVWKLTTGKGKWSYIVFVTSIALDNLFALLAQNGIIERGIVKFIGPPFFLISFGAMIYSFYLAKKGI